MLIWLPHFGRCDRVSEAICVSCFAAGGPKVGVLDIKVKNTIYLQLLRGSSASIASMDRTPLTFKVKLPCYLGTYHSENIQSDVLARHNTS